MSNFKTYWIDRGREPQCKPNPKYPNGIDADISDGAAVTCTADLPYPARRCGIYIVECETCGMRFGVTTAGRPDDPRSVKLACKTRGTVQ
jgi:hypothetical protein